MPAHNLRRVIAKPALLHACPKCLAAPMQCTEFRYPTLRRRETELACMMCGLNLWPRIDESPRQSYYRWLMDRFAAY